MHCRHCCLGYGSQAPDGYLFTHKLSLCRVYIRKNKALSCDLGDAYGIFLQVRFIGFKLGLPQSAAEGLEAIVCCLWREGRLRAVYVRGFSPWQSVARDSVILTGQCLHLPFDVPQEHLNRASAYFCKQRQLKARWYGSRTAAAGFQRDRSFFFVLRMIGQC